MSQRARIILSIITVLVLGLGTLIGILLVQGYTVDPKTKKVVQTGVLVVNSVPSGAAIYIDDHYQNTTNTSISFLPSKTYKVRLTKEGYTPWEKDITIDNKIISEIEAIMWPAIPSVNPITNTGTVNVAVSPDGQKVAYGIKYSEKDKAGLWIMDMAKRTVFSGTSTDFSQIARNTSERDFSTAEILWSPDSKQIVATLQESAKTDPRFTRNFILDIAQLNTNPADITLTKENVLKNWSDEWDKKTALRLSKLATDPQGIKIASESALPLKWSYDETMFLYATSDTIPTTTPTASPSAKPKVIKLTKDKIATETATLTEPTESTATANYKQRINVYTATYPTENMKVKVYDIKKKKSFDLPSAKHYIWYPVEEKADREIQHLIMVEDGDISIVETDGKNKSTIYSGPFENNVVFPWPDGGRLVILTNFNLKAGVEPNLYTINLR